MSCASDLDPDDDIYDAVYQDDDEEIYDDLCSFQLPTPQQVPPRPPTRAICLILLPLISILSDCSLVCSPRTHAQHGS